MNAFGQNMFSDPLLHHQSATADVADSADEVALRCHRVRQRLDHMRWHKGILRLQYLQQIPGDSGESGGVSEHKNHSTVDFTVFGNEQVEITIFRQRSTNGCTAQASPILIRKLFGVVICRDQSAVPSRKRTIGCRRRGDRACLRLLSTSPTEGMLGMA